MSGYICGKVVFDNQTLGSFDDSFDKSVINQYKLDQFDYSSVDNAQFGCGLIHVTEEDKSEKLPFYDVEAGLYITADVILDNRDELIQELSLSGIDKVITDGFIVLEAYKKWGYDTPKHLLGDFAFVIWDVKKQELFITKDHTGTRSLYYSKDENSIRFSTTLNPLIRQGSDKQELLNEEWLTMYLALPFGLINYDTKLTMYKNVFQCPIADSLVISKSEIKALRFWDPLKLINKKSKKFSENDWRNSFSTIFEKSVKCCTRSSENIGVFLSGGLDSTSVAAIAAKQLEIENKHLHSFTGIPQYEISGYNEKFWTTNEKADVQLFIREFPNIIPNYLDCANQDILSIADELIEMLEMPFKAIENYVWINEVYKKANTLGCKILLTGQFGNVTISRGDFFSNIQTLKKHGRYLKIWNEVDAGAKLYHISKRTILNDVIIMNIPEVLKKIRRKILGKKKSFNNTYLLFIKETLLEKYEIVKKLKNQNLYESVAQKINFYEQSNFMLDDMRLTMMGEKRTKMGLRYGLVERDPTEDVRVIEFCLKAPFTLFVENGIERKLIRDAMKDIVPDKIRLNHNNRGVQGVDWDIRIKHNIIRFNKELEMINQNQFIFHYLKKDKLNELLKFGSELFEPKHKDDLKQIIHWILISKILKSEEW